MRMASAATIEAVRIALLHAATLTEGVGRRSGTTALPSVTPDTAIPDAPFDTVETTTISTRRRTKSVPHEMLAIGTLRTVPA